MAAVKGSAEAHRLARMHTDLIQNKDARILQYRTRKSHALLLASAQSQAPLKQIKGFKHTVTSL